MANETIPMLGAAEGGSGGDELDLREVWRALLRRKLIFFATVLLITGCVYTYSKQQTPLFTSKALIQIQGPDTNILELDDVVEDLTADSATIESEIERLTSRAFMRRVVNAESLQGMAEFNPLLGDRDNGSLLEFFDITRYLSGAWLESTFGDGQSRIPPHADAAERATVELEGVIDEFASRYYVEQVGRSYVLAISITSEDPRLAAQIANTTAQQYMQAQVESKYEASERAIEWLGKRIEELRGEVLEAEGKIVEYRSKNNIVDTNNGSPLSLQLTQLNTQLALSQAQRAEAEARLAQTKSLLKAGGIQEAAKVLTSPLLAELRIQETSLVRRLSELSAEFGQNHPRMLNVQGELVTVRSKLEDEVRRVVQDLENEVAVAKAREVELQSSLQSIQSQSSTVELAHVELRNLTREAETNRQLFETFLTRFREIVEQQELQEADARIMSAADVPSKPSSPRTKLVTIIALAGSLAAGALLVFLLERWDSNYGFRSAEEIQALGLRALALVPDLSRKETNGIPAEEYILERPNSAYAEALQRIRTNLFLMDARNPPKSVLITSSVPLEGKSTIASALARQSARSGLKVILVDADLRRPRLHDVIGIPNQDGLSEVLTGGANPESAIQRDEKSGLDFLPAGFGSLSPPDLFRSSTMKILLEEMTAYYDLVMIDSPPVAAVSDSFTLSGLVDKSIYVVRWEDTPRNVALAGIRQMLESGGDVAGIVLSRVDVKKHARYGYADSGHYQGNYRKYYVN
ncbi:MAG: polysaccharide biosynthesis tyrosine autokinase [Pseudomonadota bacterium]